MCQKPIETTNDKPKRKCFVVLFSIPYDQDESEQPFSIKNADDYSPIKVFTSLVRAKSYIEKAAESHKEQFGIVETYWENEFTFWGVKENKHEYKWEINETDLDDEVESDFHYPPIEKENDVLRKECYRLRKDLADVTQRNAVAATYATMWDGGWNYTKERVLEILHIVRDVLAGDHQKVTELFENWLRNREAK